MGGKGKGKVTVGAPSRLRSFDPVWIRQGCRPDSELLPLEQAALVRCYAALLAAVHHETAAASR